MIKNLLLALFCLLSSFFTYSQILIDDFEDGIKTNWVPGSSKITLEENDGVLKVNSAGAGPSYEGFGKTFSPLNMSKHSTITLKIMVPTGSPAVRIRMDVTDNNGFDSNWQPIVVIPPADSVYHTYTFTYTGKFKSSYPAFNNMNPESIVRVYLFINPGLAAFTGSFYIDDIVLENAQDRNIISLNSIWKYLDNGTDPGSSWKDLSFDDSSWSSDSAELGYGDGDEKTIINYGIDPSNKYVTSYFRKKFNFVDTSAYQNLVLKSKSDDGVVIYLNGSEVYRYNMPSGAVTNSTLADVEIPDEMESEFQRIVLPEVLLDSGENILAAEVHLASTNSTDLSFDLSLEASTYDLGLVRGPYLQSASDTSILIKWRTLQATESRVRFGNSPANLSTIVDSAFHTTEHEVLLTGLTPATTYYYSIGTANDTLSGADSDHYFITSPVLGTELPIWIWVTGDAGKTGNDQRAVRDAYVNFMNGEHTDVWLLLGDNAYNEGTDEEYQLSMFENMFEEQLKNMVVWPTPGNHDLRNYTTEPAPYYDIFSVPIEGESGGVASGTESYFSFDYGNIHFVSLDSYGTPRDSTAAMAAWLKNDLAATSQKWIIAYWHHPPYSKGTHDSDDEDDTEDIRMVEMREQILPLLEQKGVDLVLTGHSHNYERSYLIHGFYGFSSEFLDNPHIVNEQSSGRKSEGKEYRKNPMHAVYPDKGAVFSVVGCSGLKSSNPKWKSQAGNLITNSLMHKSYNQYLGSMSILVNKDTLTASFIDNQGNVQDDFTIVKDVTKEISLVTAVVTPVLSSSLLDKTLVLYPNPTTGKISFKYTLENSSKVEIELLDESGKKIRTLYSGKENKGENNHEFELRSNEKGVLILQLKAGKESIARKIVRY